MIDQTHSPALAWAPSLVPPSDLRSCRSAGASATANENGFRTHAQEDCAGMVGRGHLCRACRLLGCRIGTGRHTEPGVGASVGERRWSGRRGDVHPVGGGSKRRPQSLRRHDAALLPVHGRDRYPRRHRGGHDRGSGTGRVGTQQPVVGPDCAADPWNVLLRRLRKNGIGRVRHRKQLFAIRPHHRNEAAARAERGGGGLCERRQPGRRGDVHPVGDGAQRGGRSLGRHDATLLPVRGRYHHHR